MKNRIVILLMIIFGVSGWLVNIDLSDKSVVLKNEKVRKDYSNAISMMYETGVATGIYEEASNTNWPSEGYIFNETLSKCEQGSSLSWDDDAKKVKMVGNVSDKCYVYFDVYVKPSIADVCNAGNNLAGCVKNFYNTYGSDKSNIYYHTSSLANSAGDNSYRYAGSYESVENYVCFGSDAESCPWDNMYRIIGVFDNQVKLIKADYAKPSELGTGGAYGGSYTFGGITNGKNDENDLGGYYWNSNSSNALNSWNTSELNLTNLNGTYLNSFNSAWQSKIATTTWKVGGNSGEVIYKVSAPLTFKNEITNPLSYATSTKKIGLMYLSDYAYSADPSEWAKNLYDYSQNKKINWIYNGLSEWTITPNTDVSYNNKNDWAFAVSRNGYSDGLMIYSYYVNSILFVVRPTFYLESSVLWNSGSGSVDDPIRVG